MKRVLVTGMSGTGKSTTINALAELGYKAVDADEPDWSEPVRAESSPEVAPPGEPGAAPGSETAAPPEDAPQDDAPQGWVWREDRIDALLSQEDADVLFVSGRATNQVRFYPRFDHIVLLTAPAPVMIERLRTKTANGSGKAPVDLVQIVNDTATVEPLLRRQASLELATDVPVGEVVEAILHHVLA